MYIRKNNGLFNENVSNINVDLIEKQVTKAKMSNNGIVVQKREQNSLTP